MFVSNKRKRDHIKRLLKENTLSMPMLIKLTYHEITEYRFTLTLKEIRKLINLEFGTDIEYGNFQRCLHRIDKKIRDQKVNLKESTQDHGLNIDYDHINDLNIDQLL